MPSAASADAEAVLQNGVRLTHQASRISFWRNRTKVIIWHGDHDSATGCIGPASSHCSCSGESLIRPVFVPDALKVVDVARLTHSLLGHSDGSGEGRVDTRVGSKLCWEWVSARRASLLALSDPLFEACQTEIVLTWCLQSQSA